MDVFKSVNDILLLDEKPSNKIGKLMEEESFRESSLNILNELSSVPQDKEFHPEGNVWNHTKMVLDLAAKVKEYSKDSQVFMWSALFHDIGKIKTTKFIKGRYRSYNHDIEGEAITYKILSDYVNDEKAKNISEIVRFHMHHIYILKNLPFSNIDELIKSENYNDIILLFVCDKLGRGNQNKEEKINTLKDIILILDKLEERSDVINDDIRKIFINIKDKLIK